MKYFIEFEGKEERFLSKNDVKIYPLGSLIFSFLDIDWYMIEQKAQNVARNMETDENPHFLICSFYQETLSMLEAHHPMLTQMLSNYLEAAIDEIYGDTLPVASDFTRRFIEHYPTEPMSPELYYNIFISEFNQFPLEPVIEVAKQFVEEFIMLSQTLYCFHETMQKLVYSVLDRNGEGRKMPPANRLYLAQETSFTPYIEAKELYRLIGFERRLRPFIPETKKLDSYSKESIESEKIEAYSFYTSNDVRAVIFMELEYMCINNYAIQKCENCGGYFLPFSSVSLYCDRPTDGIGKTCKEIAPTMKFKNAVRDDAAKSLFDRVNNKYRMRTKRNPAYYPKADYEIWKERAENLLSKARAGDLQLEEFERLIGDKKKAP